MPSLLPFILASHSWPMEQIHHVFLFEPGVKSLGVKEPFLVGCHSAASVGLILANEDMSSYEELIIIESGVSHSA